VIEDFFDKSWGSACFFFEVIPNRGLVTRFFLSNSQSKECSEGRGKFCLKIVGHTRVQASKDPSYHSNSFPSFKKKILIQDSGGLRLTGLITIIDSEVYICGGNNTYSVSSNNYPYQSSQTKNNGFGGLRDSNNFRFLSKRGKTFS